MHDKNTQFANVSWNVNDIQDLRPDWPQEECLKFLENNCHLIRDELISRGYEIIENFLEIEDIARAMLHNTD